MTQPQKADPELVKALAREAKALSEDRAFQVSTRALHAQWYGQLMNDGLNDTAKIVELVAKLRTLEAIPKMLEHLVTSETMRGQNGRGR